MNRQAEDLWWFEDGQGTVAFPMSREVQLMRSFEGQGWSMIADGRRFFVPDQTVADRRFYFPAFPRGQLQEGQWRVIPFPG